MATLPFIRPDGTPTLVDRTHAQDAVNSGYKPAMRLARPDGSQTTVAFDDLHHALDAGYKQIGDAQQPQPDDQPHGFVQSLVAPIPQMAKGLYHNFADAPRDSGEQAIKGTSPDSGMMARALGQFGLGGYRTLLAPAVANAKAAIQDARSPYLSNRLASASEAIGAIPVIGQGVDAGKGIISQYLSGDHSGAAGSVLGNLGAAGLTAATIGGVKSRLGPTPTNLTPAEIAARNVAKSILPKEGDFNSLTDVLQREKGNVEQYAGKNGLTTRTPLDTGVAARSSANDLNSFYNEKLLAPHATEQVPVPMNFEDVGSRSINGSRYANLGQINARVGQLNDLLRAGQNNATVGQTMTDLAKMADLQAEKTALTDILHNKLGELNGLDPNAVAGIRQSVGARYELADQLQSGANRTTLKAGQADRTGSTISKPTVTSTAIDAYNRIVRGGPEKIANRAFQKTYPQLDVPAGVGNPASLEELKASGISQYLKRR